MPEVRKEVIVVTAVLVSVLVSIIGYQALYNKNCKKPFVPKKAIVQGNEKSNTENGVSKKAELVAAPHKDTLEVAKFSGRVLEK